MLITDFIKIYENAMPSEMAEDLIQRFDASTAVSETTAKAEDGTSLRSFLEADISDLYEFIDAHAGLVSLTEMVIGKYMQETPNKVFPAEIGFEHIRIRKYRAGENFNDHCSYHVDVTDYSSARRFMSIVWYLNDVGEGGETIFPHPNLRIQPKTGRVLIFPSLWMYPHLSKPPISGDKYILTAYLHYV